MIQTHTNLTKEEMTRYSRHLLLPEVGISGQEKLKNARILLIGVGGLGSPASLYLAAAGVGTLGLVEFDTVDTTNLQRQIIYRDSDKGRPKLKAAAASLRGLNPALKIEEFPEPFGEGNGLDLVRQFDVIIDGSDNFATRYLVSDACVLAGKPYVYGSIFRFEGQASVFWAGKGPCYRCLYPAAPEAHQVPSCAEGGVLGVLPGLIGTVQATEAIKLITGIGEPLIGRLLTYDALAMSFQTFKMKANPNCRACGVTRSITKLERASESCSTDPATPALATAEWDSQKLAHELSHKKQGQNSLRLIDVRSESERKICHIEGDQHIPLDDLPMRLQELSAKGPVVFYCKSGVRSQRAAALAAAGGLTDVASLRGGILAWIENVDPSLVGY